MQLFSLFQRPVYKEPPYFAMPFPTTLVGGATAAGMVPGNRRLPYHEGMELVPLALRDVALLQPRQIADDRGWFAEFFNGRSFAALGLPTHFAQDNQSYSKRGVLRGLHYQLGRPQGKLVRVLSGHIWDVAVDLRSGSSDFGRWAGFHLKADPPEMLWIPEGFAHGFLVLSEAAEVLYKTTDFYDPAGERCIRWDDSTLNIAWPLEQLSGALLISEKDSQGELFTAAELPE